MPQRSSFDWERKPGFDLAGKSALVIGALTPAGPAIASALAEAGANVSALTVTHEASEREAFEAVLPSGGITLGDVRGSATFADALARVFSNGSSPSIVVYAADLLVPQSISDTTDAEFELMQAINVNGAFVAARAFARSHTRGPGRLIFVNSIFAERGVENVAGYAAARAGTTGLMTALSQELGGRGITANCISTGWMDWTLGRGADDIGQNRLLRFIPARRFGKADDLGALAVLLASDAAGYLNGQTFHVDGGIMTHL